MVFSNNGVLIRAVIFLNLRSELKDIDLATKQCSEGQLFIAQFTHTDESNS